MYFFSIYIIVFQSITYFVIYFQAGIDRVSCSGHNNQRAVVAGLKVQKIQDLLTEQRALVAYLNRSSTAKSIFMDAQEEELAKLPDRRPEDQPLAPMQDCPKTWGSTYDSIIRNLQLEDAYRTTANSEFVERNNPEFGDKIATGANKKLLKEVSCMNIYPYFYS